MRPLPISLRPCGRELSLWPEVWLAAGRIQLPGGEGAALPAPTVEWLHARDHRVPGITAWPWAALLSLELVTVGTERQPSRCPAWQPGTLPMGPSGILSGSFQKPHRPFLLPGERRIGERAFGWQSTPALLSWAPRAGLESPPLSAVPARGSVLPCGSRAWLWRVDHLSRGRRQRGSLAKPWPHPGHRAPHWCCDTGVSPL